MFAPRRNARKPTIEKVRRVVEVSHMRANIATHNVRRRIHLFYSAQHNRKYFARELICSNMNLLGRSPTIWWVVEGNRLGKMRRVMGMNRLISAAHAAGYAMAAEDISEPRGLATRVPSTAIIIRPVQRGVIASAQRSVRRMWLQWCAEHWDHRAAA
jgi:hypothetical protein